MTDENDSAGHKGDKQNPPPAPIGPINEAPASGHTRIGRDQNPQPADDNFDRDLARWTKVLACLTGALFIGSLLQFWAMRGQQNVMQGQLEDAKQSRIAFLSVKEIPIYARQGDPRSKRDWEIRIIWLNSGKTEALGIFGKTTWYEADIGSVQTSEQKFNKDIPKLFLAPTSMTDAGTFFIADETMKRVQARKNDLIIKWRVSYRDKFGGSHETGQGWVINGITGNLDGVKPDTAIDNVRFVGIDAFTCVDADCKKSDD